MFFCLPLIVVNIVSSVFIAPDAPSPGSFRDEHTGLCETCPRGRFGDSNALTSSAGCTECPPGKFRDAVGGRTALDCTNCTAGRYASSPGAEACGGTCPLGKHSTLAGARDGAACSFCPKGYRSEQCDRKDNSRQAKRQRERAKRERIKRSRQDAARSQAASTCEVDYLLSSDLADAMI